MDKQVLPLEYSHRLLSPRIAYIVTTVSKDGTDDATPISNLTSVSTEPEALIIGIVEAWLGFRNIRETGQFVVNVPPKELMKNVWLCAEKYSGIAIPEGFSKTEFAGLTLDPSSLVAPKRIRECIAHLECEVGSIQDIGGDHKLVLGWIKHSVYDEKTFGPTGILDLNANQPLMQISGPFFTYADHPLKVNVSPGSQEPQE